MKTYNSLLILLLFAAIVVGCNRNRHDDEHVNQHDTKLYLTAYSPEYEVYVIADPFFIGETGEVLTYITSIEDFKPLTKGSVKVALRTGNGSVTQTLGEPIRPGIYDFEIQPADGGTGTLTFEIEADKGASVVTIKPIEVYSDIHEAYKVAVKASSVTAVSGSNNTRFLKEQSWKIDFSTEVVEEELAGQIIRSTGQIKNTPEDVRVISSAMAGMVLFSGINLFEGTEIKPGQSLFRIDASLMAENNLSVRFAEVESEYNRAKAEYERKEKLAAERIVSESELNRALADYKRAEADYNNLNSNFTAGVQLVSSPVSGYLTKLLVDNGEYVDAGQPVMSISKNRNLIVQTEIQPNYYDLLDNITSVNFRLLNGDHTYSLDEKGGRILSYSKSVDLHNPLITLTMEIENGAGMLPGSFVELFLKTEGDVQVITVPNESIIEEMGSYFVYVQLTPELFEKRPVEKGATDGRRTEILKGLSVGERVVGKGAVMLKLSQSTGSVDVHSGHAH